MQIPTSVGLFTSVHTFSIRKVNSVCYQISFQRHLLFEFIFWALNTILTFHMRNRKNNKFRCLKPSRQPVSNLSYYFPVRRHRISIYLYCTYVANQPQSDFSVLFLISAGGSRGKGHSFTGRCCCRLVPTVAWTICVCSSIMKFRG